MAPSWVELGRRTVVASGRAGGTLMGVPHLLSPAPGSDSMGLDLAHRPGLLTNEIELRHKARIRQKIVFRIYPARSRCHSRSMGRSISGLTFRAHWTAIKGGLSRGIFTAAAGEIYF